MIPMIVISGPGRRMSVRTTVVLLAFVVVGLVLVGRHTAAPAVQAGQVICGSSMISKMPASLDVSGCPAK